MQGFSTGKSLEGKREPGLKRHKFIWEQEDADLDADLQEGSIQGNTEADYFVSYIWKFMNRLLINLLRKLPIGK